MCVKKIGLLDFFKEGKATLLRAGCTDCHINIVWGADTVDGWSEINKNETRCAVKGDTLAAFFVSKVQLTLFYVFFICSQMKNAEKTIFHWSDMKTDRASVSLHCFTCMTSKPFDLGEGMRLYGDLSVVQAEALLRRFKCIKCGEKNFSWVVRPYEVDG